MTNRLDLNKNTSEIKTDRSVVNKYKWGKGTVAMTRRDLAMKYFPSPTVESAVRKMARWLADDKNLLDELKTAGYQQHKQWFTKSQVEIFEKYFG